MYAPSVILHVTWDDACCSHEHVKHELLLCTNFFPVDAVDPSAAERSESDVSTHKMLVMYGPRRRWLQACNGAAPPSAEYGPRHRLLLVW
jgi:hypothetical protein